MIYINYTGKIDYRGAASLMDLLSGALVEGHKEITLTIASPGGITDVGFMLHNHIKALPIKVTTHAVGNVDSAGVPIFLAGTDRYAARLSSFMIHLPKKGFDPSARFSAAELVQFAQDLKQNETSLIRLLKDYLTHSETEIQQFLATGKRFSAEEACSVGIASRVDELVIPMDARVFSVSSEN